MGIIPRMEQATNLGDFPAIVGDLKRYYHCLVKPPLDQKISTWKTITGRLLAGSLPLFKTRSWWLRLHVTSYIM